jgi:hypothetical protein
MKTTEEASLDLAIVWFGKNKKKSGQIIITAFAYLFTCYLFMILPEEIDESLNVP